MNLGIILIVFFLGTSFAGCDFYRDIGKNFLFPKTPSPEVTETKTVSPAEECELAKLILKREKKPISIKKDPFEPLIRPKEGPGSGAAPGQTVEASDELIVDSVEFVGVGGMGDKVGVLLRSPVKKGLFFVNDEFQGLTIIDITENEVTVKKGQKTYKIKRRVN